MLGLPQSTEVKRPLPKAQLYKWFAWKPSTALWQPIDSATIAFSGLNLDAVWEAIVSSIGRFSVEQENSLTEQIRVDEERDKLLRQIATLERQMNATKQPRRKRELFLELQKLKQLFT